jgi:membrane associated rhomboid family serine protease
VAFVWLLRLPADARDVVVERRALVPSFVAPLLRGDLGAAPEAARLVTSLLLHAGVLHLAGNLLFLWVFGRSVETATGGARFLGFFVLCGSLAGLVHVLVDPSSSVPTVGASGAVSGVMGAYLALHPRARVRSLLVLVFVPVRAEVPAFVWLLAWLMLQVVEGARSLAAAPGGAAGVAWWAHVGGFAAGLLLHRFFLAGRRHRSALAA